MKIRKEFGLTFSFNFLFWHCFLLMKFNNIYSQRTIHLTSMMIFHFRLDKQVKYKGQYNIDLFLWDIFLALWPYVQLLLPLYDACIIPGLHQAKGLRKVVQCWKMDLPALYCTFLSMLQEGVKLFPWNVINSEIHRGEYHLSRTWWNFLEKKTKKRKKTTTIDKKFSLDLVVCTWRNSKFEKYFSDRDLFISHKWLQNCLVTWQ